MSEVLPRPASEISFIPFCDGAALFYPGIQRLWALNNLASYIWLRLDENISKDKLISDLAENFSISFKIAEQDLIQLLNHFKVEGLLGDSPPTQPNTSKEIDYLLPSGQQFKQLKHSEEAVSFSCLIEAYGFTCQIYFPADDLIKEFQQLYHYFIVNEKETIKQKIFIAPSGSLSNCFDIYLNEQCVNKDIPRVQLYSIIHFIFFSNCTRYLSKQGKLMFHAAALQKGDKTIMFPANSGSGKSTLAVALSSGSCGWRCFTDELAVLDPEALCITPLPIPVRIRSGSFIPLLPYYPNIPELPIYQDLYQNQIRWITLPKEHLASEASSAQISTLIFPQFSEKAKTVLSPLDKFLALEKLTATGSSEREMTLEDAKSMVRLIEQTPCYELTFSDLQEAITAIESITTVPGDRHSRAGGNPES